MKWFPFFCFFLATALFAAPMPPPVPGAGVIERELEREYEAEPLEPGKEVPYVKIDIPEERLQLKDGVKVSVCRVEIIGNRALSTNEILINLKLGLDCECDMRGIYEICEKIEALYAKRGYFLARAYPPPQKIENGVLKIAVLEGRLGKVTVEGNCFYSEEFIASYFEGLRCDALQYGAFLRALLLLNDISDLHAGAVFNKGSEPGTADLLVRVQDKWPGHLYLNANNYGRKLTTDWRVGGRFDVGSLGLYGDKLSLAGVVGFPINALYFADAIYRIPVNRNGTFVEFSYLFSKFKIEELESLHLRGESNIGTLKATHSWLRTRSLSLDVFGYFDIKQIENYALGHRIAFDKLRVLTGGVLLDCFSKWGRDYLNARVAAGIPNFLGGMSSVDSESSRPGGGGRFVQINADYDHIQNFWSDFYLYLHGSGQYSPYKLTIPQQIYIGGADTVRGYPLAAALGDMGYWANIELRIPPPCVANDKVPFVKSKWKEVLQIVGFFDTGGVHFNDGASTFIHGIGFGVRINGPWSLAFSWDLGFPINHNNLSSGAFNYIKITGQPF